MIKEHLAKGGWHHAYLIEGDLNNSIEELVQFLEKTGIRTAGNPDFMDIRFDTLRIEDARNLKAAGAEKSFESGKKIFLISANSILLEAQNTLLKLFEEPQENTHFFMIVPDMNALLPTFLSRFYLIENAGEGSADEKAALEFIRSSLRDRIDFLKDLLTEEEEDESGLILLSARSKALRFLNAVESAVHQRFLSNLDSAKALEHILLVRKYLRMPGSSAKNLLESVALQIPIYK